MPIRQVTEGKLQMWTIVKHTFSDFIEDDCPSQAAALAFYTMFSLAPVLIIVLSVTGLFLDRAAARGEIAHEVRRVVGPNAAKQVEEIFENLGTASEGPLPAILGIGTLLFGATGVMVQLQSALNTVWEVSPDPSKGGLRQFLLKRLISLGMVLGISFVMLISLVVSWILKALGDRVGGYLFGEAKSWVIMMGHELVLLAVATVLFAAMMKYLPDAKVQWQDVRLGAALTAALFVVGKSAIGLYLGSSNLAHAYGAAGSLVLILLWVYYSAMIFLLGAEFTHVWTLARHHRVRPEEGAAHVVEQRIKRGK